MSADKSIKLDHLTLGVCYYPEHWDESLWADDLKRMSEHGIEVVRVFEFAWSLVEEREGEFSFGLFDRFLNLAAEMNMNVIMCTPTATPPAWLTHKYPEVLNANLQGDLMHHGHRRHYNYNAEAYNRLSARIVAKLAERYGQHPAIIGWQIDNEINCEVNEFYSEADRAAFREYLKQHFGTLDALNDAIGARFWNQGYTDWAQVDMERTTLHNAANPHMALLEKRFISKSAIRYVKMQADILRLHIGDRFITTNGIFGHLDTAEMTQTALDFITYDSYPNFAYGVEQGINGGANPLGDRLWSKNLTNARSYSDNFGVMEQQSGANGWDFRMLAPMPKPGQIILWSMQSVAHGADFVSFFRWRTAPYGTEIYWHGLNDYSNQDNRRLHELKKLRQLMGSLEPVAGSRYEASVAIAMDYLNEWDGERDKWHGPLEQASMMAIFSAAQHSHTPIDFVHIRKTGTHTTGLSELSKYKLIFYPHPTILTEDVAKLLEQYVAASGTLVLGARTGYKDEYGRCPMMLMPGFAAALCGAQVADYTFARNEEPPVEIDWDGGKISTHTFHDILRPLEGGEVLGKFAGGYFDGQPALIRKQYAGGGAAYYLGSGITEDAAVHMLERHGLRSPYVGALECPANVELAVREKNGERYCFLLNYTGEAQPVQLKRTLGDAVTGETLQGRIELDPYGVRVLKLGN